MVKTIPCVWFSHENISSYNQRLIFLLYGVVWRPFLWLVGSTWYLLFCHSDHVSLHVLMWDLSGMKAVYFNHFIIILNTEKKNAGVHPSLMEFIIHIKVYMDAKFHDSNLIFYFVPLTKIWREFSYVCYGLIHQYVCDIRVIRLCKNNNKQPWSSNRRLCQGCSLGCPLSSKYFLQDFLKMGTSG